MHHLFCEKKKAYCQVLAL